MIKLDVREAGGDGIQLKLKRIGRRVASPTGALQQFGEYRKRRHKSIFDRQVDPYDKPHAPLKPATLSRKRRLGYDLRILHATLRLRNSFTVNVSRRSVHWSYSAPYVKYHVSGTARIPKRSPIEDGRGLVSRDARRFKKELAEWILEK